MKKNGNSKAFFVGLLTAAIIFSAIKKDKIKEVQNKTSLDQYKNRLKEFFLEEDVNKVLQEMCEFINHGINAEDAFYMVVQESNIERF